MRCLHVRFQLLLLEKSNTDFPEPFSISLANVSLVRHIPRFARQRAAVVFESCLRDATRVGSLASWERLLTSQILAQIDMFDSGQILHAPLTPPVCMCSFGQSLRPQKKSGGLRPIAVGLTLRRLASKIANHWAMEYLGPELAPGPDSWV